VSNVELLQNKVKGLLKKAVIDDCYFLGAPSRNRHEQSLDKEDVRMMVGRSLWIRRIIDLA
jgi:hypothetical protein